MLFVAGQLAYSPALRPALRCATMRNDAQGRDWVGGLRWRLPAGVSTHIMRRLTLCLPYPLEWAWLLSGLVPLVQEERTPEQALSGAIDNTIYLRFSLVCIALVIVVLHLRRVPRFRLSPVSLFLIYVMFGLTSSLWSASFVVSLGKSMELMAATLVVWITMARADREFRLQRLVNWTLLGAGLWLAYAVTGVILDPTDFSERVPGIFPYLLRSPAISANSIAQFGAFLALFCLAKALTGRSPSLFGSYYVACLAFPVAAQGRTGMVSAVVGSALLFTRRYPLKSIIAIPVTAALASLLMGNILLKLFQRGQDPELLYSLTGRTTMWEAAWQAFLTKPFFGTGFGVGSRTVFLSTAGFRHDLISSVHNGCLEVLLGVGLLGFSIWTWAVLWAMRLAIVAYLRGEHLSILIGMVVAISSTLLSIGVGGWLEFTPEYFLAVSALLWVRSRQRVDPAGRPATRLTISGATAR